MNVEELRISARQLTKNSLDISKESDYLEEQAKRAAADWQSILSQFPDDLEAMFCLAYCEAVSMVDVANEHQNAAIKVSDAFAMVMNGLDQVENPSEEQFGLLKTVADCGICLARRMNEQGVLAELMGFGLFVSMGMDDDEKVESTIVALSDEFACNVGLLKCMVYPMHGYWKKHSNDGLKETVISVAEAAIELLKESPGFMSDDPAVFVFSMADIINEMDSERFYCIPAPQYQYCDFEVLATFKKMMVRYYQQTNTCARVKKYNKEMRQKKDDYFASIRQQKIDAYWASNPGLKEELEAKMEAAKERVEALDRAIAKLQKTINHALKSCLDASIPEEKTKAELSDKLYQLRQYFGTLGLFKGKEKKRVQEEMAIIQAQLVEADKAIDRAKKENKRRAEESTREDKKKLAELKRERDAAHTELCNLRTQLEDPTV